MKSATLLLIILTHSGLDCRPSEASEEVQDEARTAHVPMLSRGLACPGKGFETLEGFQGSQWTW